MVRLRREEIPDREARGPCRAPFSGRRLLVRRRVPRLDAARHAAPLRGRLAPPRSSGRALRRGMAAHPVPGEAVREHPPCSGLNGTATSSRSSKLSTRRGSRPAAFSSEAVLGCRWTLTSTASRRTWTAWKHVGLGIPWRPSFRVESSPRSVFCDLIQTLLRPGGQSLARGFSRPGRLRSGPDRVGPKLVRAPHESSGARHPRPQRDDARLPGAIQQYGRAPSNRPPLFQRTRNRGPSSGEGPTNPRVDRHRRQPRGGRLSRHRPGIAHGQLASHRASEPLLVAHRQRRRQDGRATAS